MRRPRTSSGGAATASRARSSSRILYQDFLAHAHGRKLFAQDLYGRRRSEVSDQGARIHRICLAFALHRQLLIRPVRAGAGDLRARDDHHRYAVVQARRQAAWWPRRLRHDGGDRFRPQDRADLRLVLCRRDEEVGVHRAQLLSAAAGRDADALLGQCRQGRRRRSVLRPVRDRQDHAVGRSEPYPHR